MNEQKSQNKDIQSLAGKIDKAGMGKRYGTSKPKKDEKKAKQKKQRQSKNIVFKGGNLLTQKFDETVFYRPKTQQNKLRYENFLGRLNGIAQDYPQEVLISMADQILAILKSNDSEIDKKVNTQLILRQKISQQLFLDLLNIIKTITDFNVEEEAHEDMQIAIDEEQDSEDNDESEEKVVQDIQPMEDDEAQPQNNGKGNQGFQVRGFEDQKLDPNKIDAHWLHSQLCKHFQPTQAKQMESQVLRILNSDTKLQTQNGLLTVLNYQNYELIKLLLQNRQVIYYCTTYHQSQNQKQKEQLLQEMRQKDISIYHAGKRDKIRNIHKKSSQQAKIESQNLQDQEMLHIAQFAKDQEINRINKKMLDLSLHDSADRTTSKQQYKFKLPGGATKTQNPGYQQVYIPASHRQVKQQLIQIDSLPKWMHPVFAGIKRLNPIQSTVCEYTLKTNKNMLVCAPTSAGKTNIALMSILRTISQFMTNDGVIDTSKFKIVYIAPMKALVAEITGNLTHRLKDLGITVKELTGDMHLSKAQIEQTQVIVSTPQKWDIVTRKAGDRIFTQQVRLMIVDQIHLLSDSRGPVLESLIARTIRQSELAEEHVRIVGLSATLPNYRDVGATLRVTPKNGLFYFDQSYRPVPLEQLFCGVTEKKGVRKMMMINEILYDKVMARVSKNQMIIFVHSRRDTARTARYIKDTAFAKNQSYKILRPESESKRILQEIVEESAEGKQNKINNKDLKQLLADGIGIHHAGLSRSDRDYVQQLFADRHLNILVSTATLAWGVNLPAHTVIIKGTQVYSPEEGRWIEITLQDIMQMLGRAGRPRYDQKGEGIIISGYQEIRYYLGMLNMQVPLQSQMINMLPDQLNAQIVLGAVTNIKDGVNWLGYTYLYVRMLKNPKYYSISLEQLQQDPELLKRRVNLIHTAASILQRNELIRYDRRSGAFNSTFLGKIASYYYVKYSSMAIYKTNLKPNSGLIQLFKIFSMSSQFRYLSVRDQQKNQLTKLMESVPVPIKGSVDETTSKISVLLQAHISRLQLQGYALNVDKVYVTQSASRIMRALFQISVKRGWGQIAQRCLELAKMIDKQMWSCMNPLRQFKAIPEYVLSRLEKKQQFSWQSFYQMTPQQIGDLTKFPKLGKILYKFVHHVPRVQINAYAQPVTRSCLKVEVNIKSDFKWDDEIHGRDEPFWLFVLDCNQENLLYSYYFTLSKKQQNFYIQFIVPLFEILHPLYYIKVISDRWICADNVLPLSFKSMILPNKFPAPTQILDLQPIPQSSLPSIAKQMKISYLNQIQTQTYHAFVNLNDNIFLGAAEGSGKFTLALFSVFKCLQKHQKAVIMFPNKEIRQNKIDEIYRFFSKHKTGITKEDIAKDSAILLSCDIILTTPEAWDVLTRRWKIRKGFDQIGVIVLDSMHMLDQHYSIMEVVISRMRYISTQLNEKSFKIIGLSASVADYQDLGKWIGVQKQQNLFNFHPNIRQNSVQIIFSSYDQTIRQSRLHMMQKNVIHNVRHFNRNALVVVNDKKQAKLTALDFVSLLSVDSNPKKYRKIPDDQMKVLTKKISDQYLIHVLEYGIGYAYESMSQIQKQIVLKLFQMDGIGILIISQEIKWQICLKAFIVAILDCSYFDTRNNRWADYSIADMVHLMGLASISQKDKNKGKQYNSAKFLIMCHGPKKNYYKKFLYEPYPVESLLHVNLANHLISAIAIGSIKSKQGCIDWLTWTFMYRRLSLNPNYYNMQQVSQEGISTYLSQMIQNTVDYLQGVKCIQVEDQMDLSATNLGIICSYYYIKVETVGSFVQKITESMKLRAIMELICEAQELKDMGYKPGQYHILGQILTSVHEANTVNKAHSLLLIHLNRIPVSADVIYEIRSIVPTCVKLIQALVDIIYSFGYLKPLILCMQLSQMIVQAMDITDSKLLQVMDSDLADILQTKFNVKDITDFVNMDDNQRDLACKGKDMDKIAMLCNRYPNVSIQAHFSGINQDQELQVTITLKRQEQLQDYQVSCPYFPGQKQQFWWIAVGNKQTNRVLANKRVPLKMEATVKLSFDKIQGSQKYSVYALCDSYLGCDLAEQITLEQ